MEYSEFLRKKTKHILKSGFILKESDLNKHLFDFQKYIVKIAIERGKYAVFAECGLGKTIMQLEWAHQISIKENKPILILAPLAVSGQTIDEGVKFGIEVNRWNEFIEKPAGIFITNYEQIDNIDVSKFVGIVLDESSILKNFQGKTKQKILDLFEFTPYKLACTATPSPNDPMELGNHSEFLGVMKRSEMLAMYFVHDGGDTAKWRIKRHATDIFYQWVSTWAVMLNKPSNIGFSDKGFILPKLNIVENHVKTKQRDNGQLFNDVSVSATEFNRELRITKVERLSEAIKLINKTDCYIIWVNQNEEADYVTKHIDCTEVRGNESTSIKEKKLLGFGKGEFRIMVTKKKIAQFGLNYQNCHNQIFASLDFSFESLYQSIRRSYRFGQKHPVNIYLITTDTMQNVIKSIKEKELKFKEMQDKMAQAISKFTNDDKKVRSIESIMDKQTESYRILFGDCVKRAKDVPDNKADFTIFSPPFADLYTYSDKIQDMGNVSNYGEFVEHFQYLVPELKRILKPGRNMAIHCMDLPIQKGKEGYIGLRDFTGMLLKMFLDEKWVYHSRVTIWKDPVVEMQRTKALGLLHKQVKKDATMSRVGIPDYLLIFRNEGENEYPVKCDIPVDLWQKWASPVWNDINYSKTLQYRSARSEKDEKHIAPLQLETINRAVSLWTNEGDTVFSPFAGIGSEGYESIKLNRKFIGIELKESYFNSMEGNLNDAEMKKDQLQAFES